MMPVYEDDLLTIPCRGDIFGEESWEPMKKRRNRMAFRGGGEKVILKKVEALCAERKISIARLEKECGFGNATIRGWNKSMPNLKSLMKVADYFGKPSNIFWRNDPQETGKSIKKFGIHECQTSQRYKTAILT